MKDRSCRGCGTAVIDVPPHLTPMAPRRSPTTTDPAGGRAPTASRHRAPMLESCPHLFGGHVDLSTKQIDFAALESFRFADGGDTAPVKHPEHIETMVEGVFGEILVVERVEMHQRCRARWHPPVCRVPPASRRCLDAPV